MTDDLSLTELAEQADVTPRTVRYYIESGLLPAPGTAGPGAHYDATYLDRLRLIKRLQKGHLPLAEIRARLEELGDDQVRELANEPEPPAPPAADSAAAYVRDVIEGRSASYRASRIAEPATLLSAADLGYPSPGRYPTSQRSQWDRIAIDADIEIHVRRPLTREKNRALQELLNQARNLFGNTEER